MTDPRAFLQSPNLHPSSVPPPRALEQYDPARHVPPTPLYAHPPLPRSVPTLTVYAGAPARFNAEASGLLSAAPRICVRRPPAVRPGRTSQLWEVGPGECLDLLPHPAQLSQLRVHLPVGDAPPPGRYLLLPVAGAPARFSLYPLPGQ